MIVPTSEDFQEYINIQFIIKIYDNHLRNRYMLHGVGTVKL